MASTFNPPITPTAHGRPWDQSCGLLLRLEKVVVVGHSFGKAGLQARRMFLVRAWEAIPARGGRRTRPVCGKSRSSRCWTQRRVAFIALFPSFCNTPDSILLPNWVHYSRTMVIFTKNIFVTSAFSAAAHTCMRSVDLGALKYGPLKAKATGAG